MSPSYSVLPTMEGGPQNGPVPVKVYRDAPLVVERTAIWLPSPTATTPPEVPVTPPITKPSVKQCCQIVAPVDGFKAFTVPAHVAVSSPPTYNVVPSNAADAISPFPIVGSEPPIAMRVLQTGPDGSASRLNT